MCQYIKEFFVVFSFFSWQAFAIIILESEDQNAGKRRASKGADGVAPPSRSQPRLVVVSCLVPGCNESNTEPVPTFFRLTHRTKL